MTIEGRGTSGPVRPERWRLLPFLAGPGEDRLSVLFPELATDGSTAQWAVAHDAALPDWVARRVRQAGCYRVRHLTQGVLRAPSFPGRHVWVSGRVVRAGDASAASTKADGVGHRAQLIARRLVVERVGGRFWAPAARTVAGSALTSGTVILLVEGDERRDLARFAAALDRVAAASLVVLTDGPAGRGNAALLHEARAAGCPIVIGPADPWTLLDHAAAVYGPVDAEFGVLALAAGLPFSDPLVSDDAAPPVGLAAHLANALTEDTRYADPFRQTRCSADAIVDLLADWRRVWQRTGRIAVATGISFWKRAAVRDMLGMTAGATMRRSPDDAVRCAARIGGGLALWASNASAGSLDRATHAGVPVWRVEDGFVRSVGLGSNAMPPCSLVLDRSGIYYDPRYPSDLEHLLQSAEIPLDLVERAGRLVERLVAERITKYNVGSRQPPPCCRPPDGRRAILVPGQVADDASFLWGAPGIGSNLDLLRHVRLENPDAFIIYKPHPDVSAGHRRGRIPETAVRRLADVTVADVALPALIDLVQEVHTASSLSGFEALLRGRRVVCWGAPFYAGWGLTEDRVPIARRTRRRSLLELAAAALLLYPIYLDPVTRLPCPPEVLLDRLAEARAWPRGASIRLRELQGRVRAAWRRGLPAPVMLVDRERS